MRPLHKLKTLPVFFRESWVNAKTAELRLNDQGYEVGDSIQLREWGVRAGYTGRWIMAEITHVVTDQDGPWLAAGHVMLSYVELERGDDSA